MCGIVGYTGKKQASSILLEGLKKLEYRGYDSAGIATLSKNAKIKRRRCEGKINILENLLAQKPVEGNSAIGHTRWATHGRPSDENAHPHTDCNSDTVVVHNGIIENYTQIKRKLKEKGHKFTSETDTEVIAHQMEEYLKDNGFKEAFLKTASSLKGSYAIGIINTAHPEKILAARKDSPLIIGLSENGNFIASDAPAILSRTKKVVYLKNGQNALISPDSVEIFDKSGNASDYEISTINWNPIMAEKQGYRHFMLKEIFEQQSAIQETLLGSINRENAEVNFSRFNFSSSYLKKIERIYMAACGTAYHACLTAKFLLEDFLKIPCEVDIASEFRYRKPPIDKKSLLIAVTQSGETADTLAAIKEASSRKAGTAVICNVEGSSATREADSVIYTHAGPEIGVASTKAFTSQLTAIYLLTLYLAKKRNSITSKEAKAISQNLIHLPLQVKQFLDNQHENIKSIARRYFKKRDFLFLGRNINYPIALEGALKLKEISYIHAEGYPAGEMKHGPIALIDEEMPVVAIATRSSVYEKMLANIEEVKARGGIVIAVATENDREIKNFTEEVIYVPRTLEMLTPLLNVIPLQLLAYYIARMRGCDIDQPRNLAKSVTVE